MDKQETGQFLSTPSARRATPEFSAEYSWFPYFYPRPPRGGRPVLPIGLVLRLVISIHALREEGDNFFAASSCRRSNFYPRPPRGGRRRHCPMWTLLRVFLSTPSARRATADCNVDVVRIAGFLSTPSARRATPPIAAIDHIAEFLSTPSARRATSCPATPSTEQRNFYPRPPRGGRRTAIPDKPVRRDFYPRPPRGGRRGCAHGLPLRKNFYPRPPRGGRLVFQVAGDAETVISIHALREEGDLQG